MTWVSTVGLIFAAAYCIVKGVQDLRQRKYVWAALGFVAAVAILAMPIPTHAVKVDIPPSGTN